MPRSRVPKDTAKKAERVPVKAKARKPRKKAAAVKRPAAVVNEPLPSFEAAVPSLAHGHAVHQAGHIVLKSQDRRRQQLTLTLCVAIVMVFIMAAWIVNLKRLIEPDPALVSNPAKAQEIDFGDLKKQLSTSLSEVRGNLDDLKPAESPEAVPTSTAAPAVAEPPTSTAAPATITPSTLPATLP